MTTAIIMVAGRGTRLRTFTNKPKSTLEINNEPIIRRTVKILLSKNIKVALVVGYKSESIKKVLSELEVTYYNNPFYDVTNSIASLWFSQKFCEDDILLINGDVYFDESLLDDLLKTKEDAVLLCDKSRVMVGDYFFKTDKKGILKKYGKELDINERNCEYVGIAKVASTFRGNFLERLNKMINEQNHGLWWENVLYSFIGEKEIYTIDTNGKFWGEIDTVDDYHRIVKFAKSTGESK